MRIPAKGQPCNVFPLDADCGRSNAVFVFVSGCLQELDWCTPLVPSLRFIFFQMYSKDPSKAFVNKDLNLVLNILGLPPRLCAIRKDALDVAIEDHQLGFSEDHSGLPAGRRMAKA